MSFEQIEFRGHSACCRCADWLLATHLEHLIAFGKKIWKVSGPMAHLVAIEANPVAEIGACAFKATDIPDDWVAADFEDSDWPAATVHTAADVSLNQSYDEITWDSSVELIWGETLKQDNTLLCRMTIGE